jgi:hypothetical protein
LCRGFAAKNARACCRRAFPGELQMYWMGLN